MFLCLCKSSVLVRIKKIKKELKVDVIIFRTIGVHSIGLGHGKGRSE